MAEAIPETSPAAGHRGATGTPPDPLQLLRSADSRPLHEQLRDRGIERMRQLGRTRFATVVMVIAASTMVAIVGWRLVFDSQPPIESSLPLARSAPSSAPPVEVEVPSSVLIVHVAGAVGEPGLVVGQTGWRVADAIAAAGGSQSSADLNRVNLAAPIRDGERIYIPTSGEVVLAVVGGTGTAGDAQAIGPIDLNTADSSALETLPGVGPTTAASIIGHRETHGPFGSVDALVAVRGIGPATLESLRDHVTVG